MAEHPINCTAAEIKALLAGRKTQMRQLLSPHNLRIWTGGLDYSGRYTKPTPDLFAAAINNAREFRFFEGRLAWITDPAPHQVGAVMAQWLGRPLYAPGDRLYVREAWAPTMCTGNSWHTMDGPGDDPRQSLIKYRADDDADRVCGSWRSALRMPRWASRLTLTVTDVRVQRLREITEADTEAEGAARGILDTRDEFQADERGSWRDGFCSIWLGLHGEQSWNANPWVVATTFTVSQVNIDA